MEQSNKAYTVLGIISELHEVSLCVLTLHSLWCDIIEGKDSNSYKVAEANGDIELYRSLCHMLRPMYIRSWSPLILKDYRKSFIFFVINNSTFIAEIVISQATGDSDLISKKLRHIYRHIKMLYSHFVKKQNYNYYHYHKGNSSIKTKSP